MKPFFFILSIFSYLSVFGQIVIKEFFKIQTSDRNAKTIIFHKQSIDLNESFLITAFNKSSNDFTNCSWKVNLSVDCLNKMYHELSDISFDDNRQIIFKNFSVKVKNSKARIIFFNSSCLNEHSTSYFQKSCNSELSFGINYSQINSFVKIFNDKFSKNLVVN